MCVHERIKNRRNELNMSVDELAHKLNKNRTTIYRYEKGDIENLPLDVLEPLANALETTPHYLMGWEAPEVLELRIVVDGRELIFTGSENSSLRKIEEWYKAFGFAGLTDEEYDKLFEYTKFLLYRRENKRR